MSTDLDEQGPAMMRAAAYHGPGDVRITQVPIPEPGPGEVLIRVAVAGICGSDAAEYAHPRLIKTRPDGSTDAVVLGHEFAGAITAVGPRVPGGLLGEHVACGAGISCGNCTMCEQGRTNLCVSYCTLGFHRDGGMAEYVTAPASICLPVGDRAVSMDTAALAQPMAIAVHARSRGQVRDGQVVLIVGAGGIGLFLTYACASAGAHVWVADIADDRLALARALGAAQVIDSRACDAADALAGAGVRADTIFEVSGSAAGLESALGAARPGARIVAVGIQEALSQARFAEWTLGEYDILGTVAHVCATDLPVALDLLARDAGVWDRVAPTVLPLDALVRDGLVPLGAGGSARIKTLFDPSATAPRAAGHVVAHRNRRHLGNPVLIRADTTASPAARRPGRTLPLLFFLPQEADADQAAGAGGASAGHGQLPKRLVASGRPRVGGSARVLLGVGSETLPGGGRPAPYVSGLNVPSWAGASGGEGGGGDTRADGAALDAEDRACQGCRGNGRGP